VAYYLDTGTKVRYPGKRFNSNGLFEHYSLFFSVCTWHWRRINTL
jgi:hypothetical protein